MSTDSELLARFAASRDEDAFRQIVERHADKVYAVCLRVLGDAHAAEDAGQAVFLLLNRKAGSMGKGTILSAWLYRTAWNVARVARRKRGVRRRREREAAVMRAERALKEDVDRDRLLKRVGSQLDDVLSGLPSVHRDALAMRYLFGLSEKEMAHELGCPVGTVSARVSRAVARLRNRLQQRGVHLSAGALTALLAEHAAQAAPAGFVSSIHAACLGSTGASIPAVGLVEETVKMLFWSKVKATALGTTAVVAVCAGVPTTIHLVAAEGGRDTVALRGPKDKPAAEPEQPTRKEEVKKYPEGTVYVPAVSASGNPVLVVVETRTEQMLGMMKAGLKKHGVIAVFPKVESKGRGRPDLSKTVANMDAVLKRLATDLSVRLGKPYAMGFSAGSFSAYGVAFEAPAKFAGLIVVGGIGPNVPKAKLAQGKALPVVLVHGENDGFASPDRGKRAQKQLQDAGIKVTLKIVRGAGHMDLVQTKASAFLELLTGGKTVKDAGKSAVSAAGSTLTPKWKKKVGGGALVPPMKAAGNVVIYARDGSLHVLNPATGASIKRVSLGDSPRVAGRQFRAGHASGGQVVLPVFSGKGRGSDPDSIVCVDLKTGRKAWTHPAPMGVFSGVGGDGGKYIGYGSHDCQFHVLDAATGNERWKVRTGVSTASRGRFGKTQVCFAGTSGVFVNETASGKKVWGVKPGQPFGRDAIAIDEGSDVVFLAAGSAMVGRSLADGKQLWSLNAGTPCSSEPVAAGGVGYFPMGEQVIAVDSKGKKKWERSVGAAVHAALVLTGGQLAVITADGNLLLLDAANGGIRARSENGLNVKSPPVWTGKNWIALGGEGEVVGF